MPFPFLIPSLYYLIKNSKRLIFQKLLFMIYNIIYKTSYFPTTFPLKALAPFPSLYSLIPLSPSSLSPSLGIACLSRGEGMRERERGREREMGFSQPQRTKSRREDQDINSYLLISLGILLAIFPWAEAWCSSKERGKLNKLFSLPPVKYAALRVICQ